MVQATPQYYYSSQPAPVMTAMQPQMVQPQMMQAANPTPTYLVQLR